MPDPGSDKGAGWVLFAAFTMIVVGGWNIFEGLFALIDDQKMVALGSGKFPMVRWWAISMLMLDVFVIWAPSVYRPAKL
jgi:hypothetical protein